jgi:hypothetical protein
VFVGRPIGAPLLSRALPPADVGFGAHWLSGFLEADVLGRAPTVAEYLAHRLGLEHDRGLACVARVYRLFPGGWSDVLRAAGLVVG